MKEAKFIINLNGKKVGVFLTLAEYRTILHDLEDYALIKAYDEAKAEAGEIIRFEQAVREIRNSIQG
jgi:hypothetical protein